MTSTQFSLSARVPADALARLRRLGEAWALRSCRLSRGLGSHHAPLVPQKQGTEACSFLRYVGTKLRPSPGEVSGTRGSSCNTRPKATELLPPRGGVSVTSVKVGRLWWLVQQKPGRGRRGDTYRRPSARWSGMWPPRLEKPSHAERPALVGSARSPALSPHDSPASGRLPHGHIPAGPRQHGTEAKPPCCLSAGTSVSMR